MTFNKTKLILAMVTAAFALTATVASTEALAKSKKHSVKKYKKYKKATFNSRAVVAAPAFVPEYRQATTSSPTSMATAASYDDSALKQRIADLEGKLANRPEAAPAYTPKERAKDNMVFFRGGYAHANRTRTGVSIDNKYFALAGGGQRADKEAWYFGAGLDFSIDDNLFGLMNNTEVLAEVMFEYKEFGDKVIGDAALTNYKDVTVSQFTLNASPKIKFMKGSDFRPWVIPVGFAINVISPPSESITVLQPAMQFGLGADYRLWKNIYVGADARYQQNIGRTLDGVQTNGFTAGGYLGLGF